MEGCEKYFDILELPYDASVEDLKAVSGISAEMAQKIYDFFHGEG